MTTSLTPASPRTARGDVVVSLRTLATHFVEMLAAMAAGMFILGEARALLGLTVQYETHPVTSYLLMATDMAVGMGAWMKFRGHSWASTLEMSGSMYLPIVMHPLVALGLMGSMTFMVTAHVVMVAAMALLLWRRRFDYSHCS